ncbi:MAG: hypothetical protein RIF46_16530 [Cyclobacteriaceae bacterium]
MKRFRHLISNQWTVTIVGTMVGVLAAFFLNDWRENRSLEMERHKRLDKIYEELHSNKSIVEKNFTDLTGFMNAYKMIKDPEAVIMETREMDDFIKENGIWFQVMDSSKIEEGLFSYTLGINLSIPTESQMSDFAWTSSRSSEIFAFIDFECLYAFETTYGLQKRLSNEFVDLSSVLLGITEVSDLGRYIKTRIKLILALESVLIKVYDQIENQNCR